MNDDFQLASKALERRQVANRERLRDVVEHKKQTIASHIRRTAEIDRRIRTQRLHRHLVQNGPSNAMLHPTVSRSHVQHRLSFIRMRASFIDTHSNLFKYHQLFKEIRLFWYTVTSIDRHRNCSPATFIAPTDSDCSSF